MSRRFKDRPKRIARRTEKEKFERLVMPAAYICLPLAAAIFITAALSYLVYEEFPREVFVMALAVVAVPISLVIYRFFRGHFNGELGEP